jgi:RimJ/RimL family protein N-acetyltransferase
LSGKGDGSVLIETPRLVLKPHTMNNVELMNKWWNDAEIHYYDDDGPELTEPEPMERTKRRLERITQCADEEAIHFGIHLKPDEEFIGHCMIASIDSHNKSCQLGITIGEKAQWGRGLAREAITGMIRACFKELELNRIGAEVYAFNARSLRLFIGLGFKQEGTTRQAVLKRGRFEDQIMLGLLRSEWTE